jgi:hypothetical protein
MDDIYARVSKAGRVLCGRPDQDGRFTCDEALAEILTIRERGTPPERRLVSLDGWVQDKKGIWSITTRVEDLRRHGIAAPRQPPHQRPAIDSPALVRCPKCRLVQWLDAEHLGLPAGPDRRPHRSSRWVVWE